VCVQDLHTSVFENGSVSGGMVLLDGYSKHHHKPLSSLSLMHV